MNDSKKPSLQLIEEIVALRQRLADIEELAHMGSWIWSVATGAVDWSQKIYHIFGVDPKSFSPDIEAVLALFHPDDRHLITKVIDQVSGGPGRFTFNARIVRPSGELRHVISTAMGYFNADGVLERISGTVQDITDQKADEQKLKESERRYALVVDGLNDGLVDWNITSNTVYYSQQWKEMLGLTNVEIGEE
jgi:PAS domain S-box-containing protein